MEIDNFNIIRSHLTFSNKFDRYVINIIKRPKDIIKNNFGSNESQRLIRTYYIGDLDYFDRKIPAIKELCQINNARAYILPQVRNNKECLINLGKLIFENLDNPTIKLDGIVRKAVCSLHSSRDKKWILDLDNDNLVEYVLKDKTEVKQKKWTSEKVLSFVQKQLVKIDKKESEAYLLQTKNGHCLVTSPFNLQEAYKKCNMLFQGESKIANEYVWTGPGEGEMHYKKVNGWLIKDGMALCYCNIK